MGRALHLMLPAVLALALALPAEAGEESGDEAEKTGAPAVEAAPAPLDPAILGELRAQFADQQQAYTARLDPGRGVAFEVYLREEFEYYQNVGYGIVLGLLPAIFATSLGVGLGYCADGMDGENCRAAAMGSGVPVMIAVAILGGTFITTYGMKLDKLDKILGGQSAGPGGSALAPQLAPLLDGRGRPGGVSAGIRF